ncbi:MAG: hypothetical protein Aurels2KO_22770 [Aureliella sp.]
MRGHGIHTRSLLVDTALVALALGCAVNMNESVTIKLLAGASISLIVFAGRFAVSDVQLAKWSAIATVLLLVTYAVTQLDSGTFHWTYVILVSATACAIAAPIAAILGFAIYNTQRIGDPTTKTHGPTKRHYFSLVVLLCMLACLLVFNA